MSERLKPQYPTYLDDQDGLTRFRKLVMSNPGHDMAAVNHNSLGRLLDSIEAQAKEIAELRAALAKWELWNGKPPELEWAVLLCSWCNTTHACTAQRKCLAPTSKAIG